MTEEIIIDLSRLEDLKSLMQSAEQFSEPWEFFFDHFADHGEFLDLGKPVKSVLLTELCKIVAKKVYGLEAKVTHRQWVHLKAQRFVHGTALLDGQLALAFYFTDIEMGMLSFQTLRGTQLMRFTSQGIKKKELNFPAHISRTVH